jgi:hypothetical protein
MLARLFSDAKKLVRFFSDAKSKSASFRKGPKKLTKRPAVFGGRRIRACQEKARPEKGLREKCSQKKIAKKGIARIGIARIGIDCSPRAAGRRYGANRQKPFREKKPNNWFSTTSRPGAAKPYLGFFFGLK